MSKKTNYIKGTFNCAETIIDAFNKNNDAHIPVAIGSGMGTGLTVGSVCGAVNAAVMIIGFTKGRECYSDENQAKELTSKLLKSIKDEYGSEICIDLKKTGVSCNDIIEFSYIKLEEILNIKG
ncbi:C-GCAxxG-C-C family (seleno)protein [uncultured Cetobacterium sp.]|uniref:C-GCAxxG-C-C family (seleno)protein n=1 Tax=uncultured Cetobacterium sp. TaxID=527638 RepID=UPI0026069678|nr:C-GCAxxG-C-C family (seleno)protein [uncultured Cetobacterium sp.]